MIRTLEAVIATIIIFSFIFTFMAPRSTIDERISYNCLKNLDNEDVLREYAFNNLVSLNNSLDECLPKILDYQVKVCSTMDCKPDLLPNTTVILTNYIIAGDSTFSPAQINLWVWKR